MFGVNQKSLPSNAYYGMQELGQLGIETVEIEPGQPSGMWNGVLMRFEKCLLRSTLVYILSSAYLSKRRILNSCEIICATSDRAGLAIAFLKWIGLVKRPLIWCTMNLYDTYQSKFNLLGKFIIRKLVHCADKMITFAGQSQRENIANQFKLDLNRVSFIHWGVDIEYYKPKSNGESNDYLFSAGGECRDYSSLFAALEEIDLPVKMVAPNSLLDRQNIPKNIQLITNATLQDVKELINHSRLVVVPTHANHYCVGQWTVFSAMSMAKPVIWTEKQAKEEYAFNHRENISLVDRKKPSTLKEEIKWHLSFKKESMEMGVKAREIMLKKWSMRNYANEMKRIFLSLNNIN